MNKSFSLYKVQQSLLFSLHSLCTIYSRLDHELTLLNITNICLSTTLLSILIIWSKYVVLCNTATQYHTILSGRNSFIICESAVIQSTTKIELKLWSVEGYTIHFQMMQDYLELSIYRYKLYLSWCKYSIDFNVNLLYLTSTNIS
jgi:hypothetical protein